VEQSAEQNVVGSYSNSIINGKVRAVRMNLPDTPPSGGTFTPSEPLFFVDPAGGVGDLRSGLSNATTVRTFEMALIDTHVGFNNNIESGSTDDFGIIAQVATVLPGSPLLPGEFIFLSIAGGLQGADIDTLQLPASGTVLANIILIDFDNLETVLKVESIEALYLVDADSDSEPEFVEIFSLAPLGGGGTPPSITTHPSSQTVCEGDLVNFTVGATGDAPLSYQWRKDTVNIGGATASSYSIAAAIADDAGDYDCVVSNAFGMATSNAATLTVDALTGDLDADGDVDLTDLSVQLANFGASGVGPEDGDLDGDTDVDLTDLALMLAAFGTTCP
jgi:hypothetical protein